MREEPDMTNRRSVKVFSAGCSACEDTIQLIKRIACPSCEVSILDIHNADVAKQAKTLGIQRVPAIVIDGKVAECCASGGPDEATLRAAGLGVALA